MKTRILSGIAIIGATAVVLALQLRVPVVLCIVVALLGAGAVYEVLYCTRLAVRLPVVACGMVLALAVPFAINGYIPVSPALLYALFVPLVFVSILKYHAEMRLEGILAAVLLPMLLSCAFGMLCGVTQAGSANLFYILLLFCWSAMADTGAYFIGVLFGKHKMAPVISPKKTWEGAVGGLLFGLISAALVCLLYQNADYPVRYGTVLGLTPIFVLLGMAGDLAASLLKRKCGIKDFGNLIPGHGGIMDRFDSILMIAPAFYELIRIAPFMAG